MDFTWPTDLVPFGSSFKLDPHTGGSESPFSRTTKTYGLAAPRWTCTLAFRATRGKAWEGRRTSAARIDAIVASLKGRQNRALLWDFDYPTPRGGLAYATGNLAAAIGATSMTITGMPPGSAVYAGDYVGGDGRPHIIRDDGFDEIVARADAAGHAVVNFEPPLKAAIAPNAATFVRVTAPFKLTSDTAGDNYNEAGKPLIYTLQFTEDL